LKRLAGNTYDAVSGLRGQGLGGCEIQRVVLDQTELWNIPRPPKDIDGRQEQYQNGEKTSYPDNF
jgi:hypothetical protein